ncbi:hypothetical protein K504DRAFT_263572 [Pleomassaria siparia CBS 279.74]|uniref:Uncharacterized protein n=1 Tax=Pleomassaria siparia CBS 279.74 TaxID=1314801 RepID=A0A6G1KCI5_9PLEO|nr:hypothetical protein K504DRAFT_263572 [Pleomassaria siparia CBS 279.74]
MPADASFKRIRLMSAFTTFSFDSMARYALQYSGRSTTILALLLYLALRPLSSSGTADCFRRFEWQVFKESVFPREQIWHVQNDVLRFFFCWPGDWTCFFFTVQSCHEARWSPLCGRYQLWDLFTLQIAMATLE